MDKVTFDYSKAKGFVTDAEIKSMAKKAAKAKEKLVSNGILGMQIACGLVLVMWLHEH